MRKRIFRGIPALFLAATLTLPVSARRFSGGVDFLDPEEYEALPMATAPKTGALPRRVDLSRWFPPPGDQGRATTCVGWSLAYALKSYQEARQSGRRPRSRDRQYSPSFLFNLLNPRRCGTPTYITKGLKLLRDVGVTSLKSFPYDSKRCSAQPSKKLRKKARAHRIVSWRRLGKETVVAETKAQLASEFPVVIGIRVGDAFEHHRGKRIYKGEANPRYGHAMVVCGYDQRKGAFRLFNSWGPRWGNRGFCWISYEAFRKQVVSAYVTQDWRRTAPAPAPPPALVPAPAPRPTVAPPPPPPIPEKLPAITISLEAPVIEHSVPMKRKRDDEKTYLGMKIRVPGKVLATAASRFHLVVRFFHPDGSVVRNRHEFGSYFDPTGQAAVSSPTLQLASGTSLDLAGTSFHIPYEALGIPEERSFTPRKFKVVVHGYWDDFEHAKSEPSDVEFYW